MSEGANQSLILTEDKIRKACIVVAASHRRGYLKEEHRQYVLSVLGGIDDG